MTVLGITLFCAGLGVATALLLRPEFSSEARLIPEMDNGADNVLKRLASVAGFAGVDFSDAEGMDAIRPDLYPNVLQSTPCILYLIDQRVTTTDRQVQTLGKFLQSGGHHWSLLRRLLPVKADTFSGGMAQNADGTVRLSLRQQVLAEEIGERVKAKFDTRSGIITITARMPDAQVAATVAQRAMTYLKQYVVNYRTEKARQDLDFYRRQLADAHNRYQQAQLAVFRYNDQHKHVVMLATTMDRQLLEAELSIAQTVYTELASQFEQSKLKVQARTPVFKVLEPPNVPLERVSPKRTLLTLLFTLSGLLLGAVYGLVRHGKPAERRQVRWAKRIRTRKKKLNIY
ncbi:hypothetical protein GCM10027085_50400 [Spirosoma aerophilum]